MSVVYWSEPSELCAARWQVSSFGSLPRAMSTAVLAEGTMDSHRAPEAYMSKVESIASTAVRAATKMDVRTPLNNILAPALTTPSYTTTTGWLFRMDIPCFGAVVSSS